MRRKFKPFVGGTLTAIPPLPEAATLRELGLPFSETELTHIRTAMALHKASRQPQLTYDGWKVIGLALNIGEVRAKQHADGAVHSRGPYGQAIAQFLNATGFAFLNKGVRWSLREWIRRLEDVDQWHASLETNDRAHLNNPIDVWTRFCEDQHGDRAQRAREIPLTRQRRGYPSLLEELQALQDALDSSEQRVELLDEALSDVLEAVPEESLQRLPDRLLSRIYHRLSDEQRVALREKLIIRGDE